MIGASRFPRALLSLLALSAPTMALGDNGQPLQLVSPQDTSQQRAIPDMLHDIHGPLAMAEPLSPLLIALIILGILLMAAAIFWWRKTRKRPSLPATPPAVIARDELMRARELMNPEQAIGYMERVSVILRSYLEARFQLPASRRTTREFLSAALTQSEVFGDFTPALARCLERCDMAKFAHQPAGIDHLREMEASVLEFVNRTEPRQEQTTGGQR